MFGQGIVCPNLGLTESWPLACHVSLQAWGSPSARGRLGDREGSPAATMKVAVVKGSDDQHQASS